MKKISGNLFALITLAELGRREMFERQFDPKAPAPKILRQIAPPAFRGERNAPCPCGSKKKFKKCCINKTVTPSNLEVKLAASEVREDSRGKSIGHDAAYLEGYAAKYHAWANRDNPYPESSAEHVGYEAGYIEAVAFAC